MLLADRPVPRVLVDALPPTVREQLRIERDWAHTAIAAVLYAGPADDAYWLRCNFAARDGARVPLIATDHRDFPLYRLATERAVSVNTTAAGGNASLMVLGA